MKIGKKYGLSSLDTNFFYALRICISFCRISKIFIFSSIFSITGGRRETTWWWYPQSIWRLSYWNRWWIRLKWCLHSKWYLHI